MKFVIILIGLCLFFQSCIIIHRYKEVTYLNANFDSTKLKMNGYYVSKYNIKFKIDQLSDTVFYKEESSDFKIMGDSGMTLEYDGIALYSDGTYYNKGVFYNNSINKDTNLVLNFDTTYSPKQANQSYTWGCYTINNDTLKIQTFKYRWASGIPLPEILVWSVKEEKLKILNDSTLKEIDITYRNNRTVLKGEVYNFMACQYCKPNSANFIKKEALKRKRIRIKLPLIFEINVW